MARANDIRKAFYYVLGKNEPEDSLFDGGRDKRTGKRYTNKWVKIAEFLKEKNCDDVYGFIYANLHYRADLDRASVNLQPIHLYSEAAWNAYELYQKDLEDFPARIKSELDALIARIRYWELFAPGEEGMKRAITDETLSISAFLRYHMCHRLGFPELAEGYANEAEYQYLTARDACTAFLSQLYPGEKTWKV